MTKKLPKTDYGLRTTNYELRTKLLYHFCRMQLPTVEVMPEQLDRHLQRTFELYRAKQTATASWEQYLDHLYPLDWFLAVGCLEGRRQAWECLFAARASRSDCLLVDALRARAVRLYPHDEERQDSAVSEFWSHLLVSETPGSVPVLARYDGQRPLVPWLIRVFQNWHISQLRQRSGVQALPEDDVALPLPTEADGRWHEAFCLAARDYLKELSDTEVLILGLRLRYRMSQREVANLLGVHEGTISRQTSQLRDRCLDAVGQRLVAEGWTGDDLSHFVLTEMAGLLMDEPRLSADQLARALAARGKSLPPSEKSER
ncbi:MAG TPA: sigma-70 family RNA polymerase sigma factor [Gemmataceae bacterium]|nr:sigma-70 family RNA polymerase sigma factor [Gemmataceae bacterium]